MARFALEVIRRLKKKKGKQTKVWNNGGTTVVAVKYRKGVVFGSDARISKPDGGNSDNQCFKVSMIHGNVYLGRIGSKEDTAQVRNMVRDAVNDYVLENPTVPVRVALVADFVAEATRTFPGLSSTELIVGGWDSVTGSKIYVVYNNKKSDAGPYTFSGSSSGYLYGVFERLQRQGVFETINRKKAERIVEDVVDYACCCDASSGGPTTVTIARRTTRTFYR